MLIKVAMHYAIIFSCEIIKYSTAGTCRMNEPLVTLSKAVSTQANTLGELL